jgi:hypothetical protein
VAGPRQLLKSAAGGTATIAGKITGRVLAWSRTVPGLAGAALVSGGVWQVFRPAGVIVAGAFLLMLDRRI